jgi:hypothetical protein
MDATNRVVFFLALAALPAPPAAAAGPTYWQDVRPVLRKHCTGCHNGRNLSDQEVSGGLALDSYEAAVTRAKRPVVRPGRSADSPLVQLVVTDDAERRMPLGRKPLPAEAVDLLRRWIDAGAPEGPRPSAETTAAPRPRRTTDVTVATTLVPPREVFPDVPPAALHLALPAGPMPPATAVAFSPDGRLLACGTYGLVTLWDLQLGQVVRAVAGLPGTVHAVRFSPDGRLLAIAGGRPGLRGDLRLVRPDDGKLVATLAGHEDVVAAVAFSPDGQRLASGGFDKTVRLWDVAGLKAERTLTSHADTVNAVAFAPDGSWLASAGKDRTVRVAEAATGKPRLSLGALDEVHAVAVSPDGATIVAAVADTTLVWWDAKTGARGRVRGGHHAAVQDVCFSRDGALLASAGADSTLRVWDPATGAERHSLVLPALVYAAALSPDARLAAAACFDGQVRLYEVGSGRPRIALMALPAGGEAQWLALTPQGYLIGSPKLLYEGRWSMGGRGVPRDPVWKAVFNPEAVARGARGESSPPPAFNASR